MNDFPVQTIYLQKTKVIVIVRTDGRTNERTNEHTKERTNERASEYTNTQTNARTNERIDERTNKRTNKRTNERTNERTKERTDERTHIKSCQPKIKKNITPFKLQINYTFYVRKKNITARKRSTQPSTT